MLPIQSNDKKLEGETREKRVEAERSNVPREGQKSAKKRPPIVISFTPL